MKLLACQCGDYCGDSLTVHCVPEVDLLYPLGRDEVSQAQIPLCYRNKTWNFFFFDLSLCGMQACSSFLGLNRCPFFHTFSNSECSFSHLRQVVLHTNYIARGWMKMLPVLYTYSFHLLTFVSLYRKEWLIHFKSLIDVYLSSLLECEK